MTQPAPKAPPFPVGTRLRYIGTRQIGVGRTPQEVTWVLFPGAEGTIVKTRPGRRGTGVQLRDEDGPMYYEDTGDPIRDETQDGYSVWVGDHDPRRHDPREQMHAGRCIWPHPESLVEWEVMSWTNQP